MRYWKALFPAVAITLCLIAASARGGSMSVPDLGSHLPWMVLDGDSPQAMPDEGVPTPLPPPAPGLEVVGKRDGVVAESVLVVSELEYWQAAPVSAALDQVPEPASMGLMGIGISGLIMLRRFRKLFS